MLTIRRAKDRGHADYGWLSTFHTFSFADYYDPRFVGFGALRVINEDTVAPGKGFPAHSHRDMEIISYVLSGALEHKDSIGNGSVIRPGEVQRMSAGTGVTHSEYNASVNEPVHFLQIWLIPARRNLAPGYEQKFFSDQDKRAGLRLIASSDGAEGSVHIQQDARVYAALLDSRQTLTHAIPSGHKAWLHVARGHAELNGTPLEAGDGAAIENETFLSIGSNSGGEVLLFDLAG